LGTGGFFMKIIVGSKNTAKVGAVKLGAGAYWPDVDVVGVEIESGVPGQPVGWDEMLSGAVNRARGAYEAGKAEGADLGVGLEGGVVEMAGRTVLCNVVAVYDGVRDSVVPGTGTPLPDSWGKALAEGKELGPLLAEKFKDYKRHIGAMPFVTNGVVLREEVFAAAVKGALAPWVNPGAYEE
jgi:inosine/xanthosine triphosphatase